MTFTIGCDPELFLKTRSGPLSAYGVIPGTKAEPYKCPAGAYQVDGMAAEFNIDPVPSTNFEQFNSNIVRVMAELKAAVKATKPSATFVIEPVMEFGEEYLAQQPDEAKELGCDPDYDAYTLKANPRPDGDRPFRTAAGHLHVGWGADIPVDNDEHIQICADFVKTLDATVGMFMTVIDRNPLRRELYGKAGAFRPKPYGVEYRTPSNVWLTHKVYRRAVFNLISSAISLQKYGKPYNFEAFNYQEIINTGDHAAAYDVMRRFFRYNLWWEAARKVIDRKFV